MMATIVMTINKAAQKGLGQHGFCRSYPKTCFEGLNKSISGLHSMKLNQLSIKCIENVCQVTRQFYI